MKINKLLIIISAVCLLISFWNRNELPGNIDYVPAIVNEPEQSKSDRRPFDIVYKGVQYRVAPEYAYDITGMIVSYRHHDNNSRMHRLSNDHLNMLDVCVVWGDNATDAELNKLDFWNGIFTCNFETRDQAAWDSFDIYKISNNHLISDDETIRDHVRDIRIGDQIRVRGYLASYGTPNAQPRGTSTTRMDTGDGACETIYVERFEIVRAATSYWRISMYASLFTLLMALFLYFRQPHKVR